MRERSQSIQLFLLAAVVCVMLGTLAQRAAASDGGWSDFIPSSDTRIVYVSSSQGNNNNSGLSPDAPVQSISAGLQKLRDGYPDWMLLRRGDVWYDSFTGGGKRWDKSGRSAAEPIRLSAYGPDGDRPRIVANGTAFESFNNRSHVAITGIHFQSASGGGDGMRILLDYGQNWLVEDVKIEGFQNNMNIQGFGSPGEIHNVRIRRSVIVDAASTGGGHSQGIYTHNVHGLFIEGCVIDSNGWSQDTNPNGSGYPTVFNHNIYVMTSCRDVEVRGNIIADGSSHGLQLRPGGIIEDNLFVRNPLAILLGGGDPDPGTHTHGVTGSVTNNVVLDGKDINPGTPRGFGIDLMNIASATVTGNVVANQTLANQPRPFSLQSTGYGSGVGINNVTVSGNVIYNWGGSVRFVGSTSNMSNVTFVDNDVQSLNNEWVIFHNDSTSVNAITSGGNRCHTFSSASQWCHIGSTNHSFSNWTSMVGDTTSLALQVDYPDPTRSVGSYNATLGKPGTHEAFMSEVRKQSRSNWRDEYTSYTVNAYIREGFAMEEQP